MDHKLDPRLSEIALELLAPSESFSTLHPTPAALSPTALQELEQITQLSLIPAIQLSHLQDRQKTQTLASVAQKAQPLQKKPHDEKILEALLNLKQSGKTQRRSSGNFTSILKSKPSQ